jgi:hypothetical protein
MSESIPQRALDLTFTLASNLDDNGYVADTSKPTQPTFPGSNGANQVKLTGRRVSATIVKAGGRSLGELQLRVFGMTLSQMNQLSTLGALPSQPRKNSVTIEAGNVGGAMATVFMGNITDAWTDFGNSPEVAFQVSAFEGYNARIKASSPSSYKGPSDAATVLQDLATRAGYTFENNGVSAIIYNTYLSGTVGEQIEDICQHAGIAKIIENNVLSIWPANGTRKSSNTPLISKDTGLQGYPGFNPIGVTFKTTFNPAIKHGALVKVQSIVQPACGTWQVNNLTHELSSEMPGGPWATNVECVVKGYLPSDE